MRLKYITLGIIILLCARSAHAATYTIDKREYVSNWCVSPYNKIVAFFPPSPGGNAFYKMPSCTGQYVAQDIILTALHCIKDEGDPQIFQISNCKAPSKRWDVKVISKGANTSDDDWALLRIQDPAGYSDDFFDVSPTTPENSTINNAGWGVVRRLSDEEITDIKNFLRQYITANPKAQLKDLYKQVSQTYHIDEDTPLGPGGYPEQLKVNTQCAITGTLNRYQKYFKATCNAQHGNSGGPYFLNNTLYGIVSKGVTNTPEFTNYDMALKNSVFYDELISVRTAPVTVQPTTTEPTINETPVVEVTQSEEEITESETAIINEIRNIDNAPLTDVLNMVIKMSDIIQLRKEYEAAKAREQSVPNKLLGGVTMAATGIGGQMLASGLAEQNADENAERDMRAYLATFRCDYGAGRNIVGGETNIQLPGGNELIQYTTEYKQLATQLRADKEALGIMPGIESEVIFDSATTGLYDDISTGIQKGAFTSLSRALLDENSADAAELQKQKDKTASNIKTGAIIAGAGAIGGLVGNMIINRDKYKDTTNVPSESNISDTDDEVTINLNINPDIKSNEFDDDSLIAELTSYPQNAGNTKTGSTTQALPVSFKTAQSDFSQIDDNLFAKAFNTALTIQLKKRGATLDSSKLKNQGGTFLAQAKQKNLNPFVSSGIAFYESTYGTSSAAKNKNNIAGLMSGGKTVTYPSVPDSIAAQARSLRNVYIDKKKQQEINQLTYDGGTARWRKDVTSITKLIYKTYNELATDSTVQ